MEQYRTPGLRWERGRPLESCKGTTSRIPERKIDNQSKLIIDNRSTLKAKYQTIPSGLHFFTNFASYKFSLRCLKAVGENCNSFYT